MVSQRTSQPVKVCEEYENNMEFVVFFISRATRDARRVRAAGYVACYDTNGLAKVEQISCFDCAVLSLFGRCIANGFIGSKHWMCIELLGVGTIFSHGVSVTSRPNVIATGQVHWNRQVRRKLNINTKPPTKVTLSLIEFRVNSKFWEKFKFLEKYDDRK